MKKIVYEKEYTDALTRIELLMDIERSEKEDQELDNLVDLVYEYEEMVYK